MRTATEHPATTGGLPADPLAGNEAEIKALAGQFTTFCGKSHDCPGQGMSGRLFHAGSSNEYLLPGQVTEGGKRDHLRLAHGDGAGLIKEYALDGRQAFNDITATQDDSQRGRSAAGRQNRCRNRQSHGRIPVMIIGHQINIDAFPALRQVEFFRTADQHHVGNAALDQAGGQNNRGIGTGTEGIHPDAN